MVNSTAPKNQKRTRRSAWELACDHGAARSQRPDLRGVLRGGRHRPERFLALVPSPGGLDAQAGNSGPMFVKLSGGTRAVLISAAERRASASNPLRAQSSSTPPMWKTLFADDPLRSDLDRARDPPST